MAGTTRLELATSDVTGSPKAHSTSIFSHFRSSNAVFIRQKPSEQQSGLSPKKDRIDASPGIEGG